jgi:hypothetical protein
MSGNGLSNHTSKGLDDQATVRIGHERRGKARRNDDCKYSVGAWASAGTDACGPSSQIFRVIRSERPRGQKRRTSRTRLISSFCPVEMVPFPLSEPSQPFMVVVPAPIPNHKFHYRRPFSALRCQRDPNERSMLEDMPPRKDFGTIQFHA